MERTKPSALEVLGQMGKDISRGIVIILKDISLGCAEEQVLTSIGFSANPIYNKIENCKKYEPLFKLGFGIGTLADAFIFGGTVIYLSGKAESEKYLPLAIICSIKLATTIASGFYVGGRRWYSNTKKRVEETKTEDL